mmetsp:Transcript_14077/g.22174  ORF Transcript_14077/g.22174 Transcript_14077/m.22174 type:complete len:546 (-) Transcript_14077:24-1661(-)
MRVVLHISGSDLARKDGVALIGKSDPYVLVKNTETNKVIGYSNVVMKNLNPEWNPIVVDVEGLTLLTPIELEVWDFDFDAGHDFIGKCEFPMEKWFSGNTMLLEDKGKKTGTVSVTKIQSNSSKFQNKQIKFSANGLASKTGTYMEILNENQDSVAKTEPKDGKTTEWTVDLPVPADVDPDAELTIQVFGTVKNEQKLGECKVTYRQLLTSNGLFLIRDPANTKKSYKNSGVLSSEIAPPEFSSPLEFLFFCMTNGNQKILLSIDPPYKYLNGWAKATNAEGKTLVQIALDGNFLEEADLLLSASWGLSLSDNVEENNKYLRLGINDEDSRRGKKIIQSAVRNSNPLAADDSGKSAIHLAHEAKKFDILRILLSKCKDEPFNDTNGLNEGDYFEYMYSQQDIQEELKKFSFGKDVVQKLISMPVDNYERFENDDLIRWLWACKTGNRKFVQFYLAWDKATNVNNHLTPAYIQLVGGFPVYTGFGHAIFREHWDIAAMILRSPKFDPSVMENQTQTDDKDPIKWALKHKQKVLRDAAEMRTTKNSK